MKKIIITDPCYTNDGHNNNGDHCFEEIEVTNEFFKVLQYPPLMDCNPKDNWDGGTYWFGGKHPIEEYTEIGNHCNDAGMTCIADVDNLEKFEWGSFCDKWFKESEEVMACRTCDGTGETSKEKLKPMQHIIDKYGDDAELLKHFKKCSSCFGEGERVDHKLGASISNHLHFLMVGDTFCGDVGATIHAKHNNRGNIVALAIDVCGFSFPYDEEEEG